MIEINCFLLITFIMAFGIFLADQLHRCSRREYIHILSVEVVVSFSRFPIKKISRASYPFGYLYEIFRVSTQLNSTHCNNIFNQVDYNLKLFTYSCENVENIKLLCENLLRNITLLTS